MSKNPHRDYQKLADYAWARAHRAGITPLQRTFWFDQFEVTVYLAHMMRGWA